MPRERRACATAGLPTGAAWRRGGVMPWASSSICRTPIDHGSTAFRRPLFGVTRRERCGRSAISICPTSIAWSRRAALGETKLRYVTLLNVLGWQMKKNGEVRRPSERYRERLAGVLSCYDRIIVTGTLPGVCYAKGMTAFLSARQIRIFEYPRFAEPLRDRLRERAAELAAAAGITIEHIANSHIRKEEVVARVPRGARRPSRPGACHLG